jgi:hypothetical protein
LDTPPDKIGFIDKSGNIQIPLSAKYASVQSFAEGLGAVKDRTSGKWGFIDADGTLAISCKFDKTYGFSDGLAAVLVANKYGFIDKAGKGVIEPSFDSIEQLHFHDYVHGFQCGLAKVKNNGRTVFIDKAGKEVYTEPE